jgi:hypothetical protein
MATTEKRVSVIENDLKEIAHAQRRNEIFLERFSHEMNEFKSEMREFKEEGRRFREEMRRTTEEMRRGTAEMRQEMNRKWGDLANKMGTVVEDIIMPGFPGILRHYFDTEAEAMMIRVRKRHPQDSSRRREFDLIAYDRTRLFLNETKSNPKREYVEEFCANHTEVFEYFPEYADKELVPIFSSLQIPEEHVEYLSEHGCYAMTMGEEHPAILNFEAVG